MRPVPGLLALLLVGCVEIRFYDAEIWVDVLYPPDSVWSLSPVNVVVGGTIQETSRVVRILPLLFRSPDPEPGYRPVRMSLWVDGEKRMEIPDTALTHRIRLPLSEGWHTLQVRAETAASRIRHVRVLAPEHFPVRFTVHTSPVYPRNVLLNPLRDTVLRASSVQVRVFHDSGQKQWVVAHPRETLRVQAPFMLHMRAYPQGLYVVAFRGDSGRAFWVHASGISAIQIPPEVSPFDRYDEQVCTKSSALVLHPLEDPEIYWVLFLRQDGFQAQTVPSGDVVLFTCRDGEAGMIAMTFEEYRKTLPGRPLSLPFHPLLVVEGGDTVFWAPVELWWKEEGRWHRLTFPEAPQYQLTCTPGVRSRLFPGGRQTSPLRCNMEESHAYMGPWYVQAGEAWYTWSFHKEKGP